MGSPNFLGKYCSANTNPPEKETLDTIHQWFSDDIILRCDKQHFSYLRALFRATNLVNLFTKLYSTKYPHDPPVLVFESIYPFHNLFKLNVFTRIMEICLEEPEKEESLEPFDRKYNNFWWIMYICISLLYLVLTLICQ